jgi:hypothetical protein
LRTGHGAGAPFIALVVAVAVRIAPDANIAARIEPGRSIRYRVGIH